MSNTTFDIRSNLTKKTEDVDLNLNNIINSLNIDDFQDNNNNMSKFDNMFRNENKPYVTKLGENIDMSFQNAIFNNNNNNGNASFNSKHQHDNNISVVEANIEQHNNNNNLDSQVTSNGHEFHDLHHINYGGRTQSLENSFNDQSLVNNSSTSYVSSVLLESTEVNNIFTNSPLAALARQSNLDGSLLSQPYQPTPLSSISAMASQMYVSTLQQQQQPQQQQAYQLESVSVSPLSYQSSPFTPMTSSLSPPPPISNTATSSSYSSLTAPYRPVNVGIIQSSPSQQQNLFQQQQQQKQQFYQSTGADASLSNSHLSGLSLHQPTLASLGRPSNVVPPFQISTPSPSLMSLDTFASSSPRSTASAIQQQQMLQQQQQQQQQGIFSPSLSSLQTQSHHHHQLQQQQQHKSSSSALNLCGLEDSSVEDIVAKTCRDILVDASQHSLKAVELANTLRARGLSLYILYLSVCLS